MAETAKPKGMGNRVAPWRFLMFVALLIGGSAALSAAMPTGTAIMTGFDVATAVFLLSLIPLFRTGPGHAEEMRRRAAANDANRAVLLGISLLVTATILVTVGMELAGSKSGKTNIALVLATLTLAWLFANMAYALHYAHIYYSDAEGSEDDARGIGFPKTPEPHYWDFVYFAFTLGMTFQTSDCEITDPGLRRTVIIHSFAAFLFNLGVIAFTINVLGSSK